MTSRIDERVYNEEHIAFEVDTRFTREAVNLDTAVDLAPGTVLGKVTATGHFVRRSAAAADGSQVAAGVLVNRAKGKAATQRAAVTVRGPAILKDVLVVFSDGADAADKADTVAELEKLGIILAKVL